MHQEWVDKFDIYYNELVKWNKKFNLTSITDKNEAKIKHFYDSLSLEKAFNFLNENLKVIDVGSGAGFPGLPLKIIYPNLQMVLLDSTRKKVEFLSHIINILNLTGIKAVWSRAEDFAKLHKDEFDVAIARALAPLNVAIELCLPFLKVEGVFLAMKSNKVDSEISKCQNALKQLKGQIQNIIDIDLPFGTNEVLKRKIVIVKKIEPTPKHFPRKSGFAKKNSL